MKFWLSYSLFCQLSSYLFHSITFGDGFFQFQDNEVSLKQAPGHNHENTIYQLRQRPFSLTSFKRRKFSLTQSENSLTFLWPWRHFFPWPFPDLWQPYLKYLYPREQRMQSSVWKQIKDNAGLKVNRTLHFSCWDKIWRQDKVKTKGQMNLCRHFHWLVNVI